MASLTPLKLTARQEQVLAYIRANAGATAREITRALGFPSGPVLNALQSSRLIGRQLPLRGGMPARYYSEAEA